MADFPLQFVLQVKNEMGSGISQATGQIEGLGEAADQTQKKAKSSGMGVGQAFQFVALNAFNLASSLIQTKRSYEDLDKAENAQRNKRDAVTKATNKLQNAEINLFKARKTGDPAKIAKAENALANAKLTVDKATRAEKLGQVELNRAHEDFYLNIIPNVISGLGTVFGLFQVMQGSGGIGGLISGFTKLALPIAAISAVFLAIKTNFLGFRDFLQGLGADIGNAIPALKPFLNVLESIGELLGLIPSKKGKGTGINKAVADLKAQFGPILDFFKNIIDDIMKGNWEKVFQRITAAAANAWEALKKAFPLLGDIESLVNKIKGGNWKGALLQIWKAAVDTWEAIKKAVPFLGDIETFIRAIAAGKWSDAFAAIKKALEDSGIPAAIDSIFAALGGKDTPEKTGWVTKIIQQITQIPERIKAAIAGGGDPFGGTGIIDQIIGLKDWSVSGFITAFKTKLTEGFKLNTWWGDDPNPPGKQMLDSFFASANTFIKANIDGFVASILDIKTWQTSIENAIVNFTANGIPFLQMIFDALFGQKDKKTGKNAQMESASQDVGGMIIEGIGNWFKDVMPKSAQALTAAVNFWTGIGTAITTQVQSIAAAALQIVNSFTKGVSDQFTVANLTKIGTAFANAIYGALIEVKQKFVNIGLVIGGWIYNAIPPFLRQFLPGGGGPNPKKLTPNTGGGAGRAAGFHGFATGPMLVGEKSTERIDVTPMSDFINRRNQQSNGGGPIMITVYSVLDGQIIAESVAKRISVNQAVYR